MPRRGARGGKHWNRAAWRRADQRDLSRYARRRRLHAEGGGRTRASLVLDLPWEVRVLERAASAGLAPRLVYCDLDARGSARAMGERADRGHSQEAGGCGEPRRDCRAAAPGSRLSRSRCRPRHDTPLQWIEIYDEALSRRTAACSDPALRTAALCPARKHCRSCRARSESCATAIYTP